MRSSNVKWRPWLIKLHRDVGYFFVGLTLIYAVSGIAVNHRRHWDYDHARTTTPAVVGSPRDLIGSDMVTEEDENRLVAVLLDRLGREQEPSQVLWRTPRQMTVFFGRGEDDLVDYDPVAGVATVSTRERRFTYWLNRVHLNDHNATWTWFADGYALGLIFLAVSGAVMLKGKSGLRGRGWWLILLGVVLPFVVLLVG